MKNNLNIDGLISKELRASDKFVMKKQLDQSQTSLLNLKQLIHQQIGRQMPQQKIKSIVARTALGNYTTEVTTREPEETSNKIWNTKKFFRVKADTSSVSGFGH